MGGLVEDDADDDDDDDEVLPKSNSSSVCCQRTSMPYPLTIACVRIGFPAVSRDEPDSFDVGTAPITSKSTSKSEADVVQSANTPQSVPTGSVLHPNEYDILKEINR